MRRWSSLLLLFCITLSLSGCMMLNSSDLLTLPEISPEHRQLASRIRDILSVYEKNADLIAIGAYKPGSNRKLDFALSKIDAVNGFLTQEVDESFTYDQCIEQMRAILA